VRYVDHRSTVTET